MYKQSLLILIYFSFYIDYLFSQACPNSCSGHGICNYPTRVCKCFTGFTGGDCSLRTCPKGAAWADQAIATDNAHNLVECSNMGICDQNLGQCTCNTGFEGAACERMSCPNTCNGAGKCLSMHQYALTADPGANIVYPYDSIWDANKIYGCSCDTGFGGCDCSVQQCPTGMFIIPTYIQHQSYRAPLVLINGYIHCLPNNRR